MKDLSLLLKRSLEILTDSERRHLIWLLLLTIVSSLVQVVGVGSVFPFLALLLNPNREFPEWVGALREKVGLVSDDRFFYTMGGITLGAFLLGLGLGLLAQYLQVRYACGRQQRLMCLSLSKRSEMHYEDFLGLNSAEVVTQVTGHVTRFIHSFFLPVILILSNAILVLFILITVLLVSPGVALGIFALIGVFYGVFHVFTSKRIKRSGETRLRESVQQTRFVSEAMGGFKEVSVLGRFPKFLDSFRVSNSAFIKADISFRSLRLTPSYILQALVVTILFVLIFVLIGKGENRAELMALLGFYGVATKQLMPSLGGIFSNFQAIKQAEPIASALLDWLHRPIVSSLGAGSAKSLKFESGIEVKDLSFAYQETENQVLKDIDLVIPRQSSIALVGRSGSGKTTLSDILIGLLVPQEGGIYIDGEVIDSNNMASWRKKIGYVPQSIFLSDASVLENIAFGVPLDEIDAGRVREVAKIAQIDEFVTTEMADGYDTIVGERGIRLSGGQRQRIGIARALYGKPELIVMDEATSALDNLTESEIAAEIEKLGADHTMVIVAHRLSTIRHCDQVCVLRDGEIVGLGGFDELDETCEEFRLLRKVDGRQQQ